MSILLQIYQGIFQWKKFCKSVKIWQNYDHESLAPFFGPPCIYINIMASWMSAGKEVWMDSAAVFP